MTLDLDPRTTALIIIDLQQGILSPEPIPYGRDEIVARSAELARALADAGGLLVVTTTDFAPGYADAPKGRADAPWALPEQGLPPGFATLVPEIDTLPSTVRITKRQMSAFFGAELDLQLRRLLHCRHLWRGDEHGRRGDRARRLRPPLRRCHRRRRLRQRRARPARVRGGEHPAPHRSGPLDGGRSWRNFDRQADGASGAGWTKA